VSSMPPVTIHNPMTEERYQNWILLEPRPSTSVVSTFNLKFWTGGSVSGVGERETNGRLRRHKRRFILAMGPPPESDGTWDVVGSWDQERVELKLVPRRGACIGLLTGEWKKQSGILTNVVLCLDGGRFERSGLEMTVYTTAPWVTEPVIVDIRSALRYLKKLFHVRGFTDFYDLTVVCKDGVEIQTNWCMLVSQSHFFKVWDRNATSRTVCLPFSGASVKGCLDFLLSGEMTFEKKHLPEMISLASYLGIEELLERCEADIISLLDTENCVDAWKLGRGLHRGTYTEEVEDFMLSNFQSAFHSWEHWIGVSRDVFQRLLLSPKVSLYGEDGSQILGNEKRQKLASHVFNWFKANPEETCYKIRLPNCEDNVEHYMVSKEESLGRPVVFTGMNCTWKEPFLWKRDFEARVKSVCLAYRRTDLSQVLCGLAFYWTDGRENRVGQMEGEEVKREKYQVNQGEHFTLVLGDVTNCIQQLNFVTSKGRVLGPPLPSQAHSSVCSLLSPMQGTQVPMVGVKGKIYSARGACVLGRLQFIHRIAVTQSIVETFPSQHNTTPPKNRIKFSEEKPILRHV